MPTDTDMPIPAGEERPRFHAWLAFAATLMAVALLYSASLDAPFHFDDDYYVVRNEPIRNLSAWRSWPWADYSYRYLYELSLGLNMYLGGMNPWGYHLLNVLGHLLAVAAVWLLTKRLIRGTRYAKEAPWLPTASAFLFGIHPLASEPVLYVMARNSGWSAMLMLWATVFALGAYDRARGGATGTDVIARSLGADEATKQSFGAGSPNHAQTVISGRPSERLLRRPAESGTPRNDIMLVALGAFVALLLWAGAVSFKQTALVWPGLLLLLWLWRRERPFSRRTRIVAPVLLAACGALFLWLLPAGKLTAYPVEFKYLLTQLVIGADAWFRAFVPHGMNIEHDYALRESFWSPPVLAAAAFHLILLALAWRWLRRKRLAGLAILWAYITVLPTNSIIVRADYLSDRHLYLFTLGAAWALVDACALAASRAGLISWKRLALAAACAAFLSTCLIQTGYQVWLFRDRTRLLEHAHRLSPNHMRVLMNLGHQYESAGRIDDAEKLYNRCIVLWNEGHGSQFPQRHTWASMAYNNLGGIAASRAGGDAEANKVARPFFEKALEIDPMNTPALDNLAIICFEEGTYRQLVDAAGRQIQENPSLLLPRLHRGAALAALGEHEQAATDLRQALDKRACARVPPRVRARALGALVSMRTQPEMQPLAQEAAIQLAQMKAAGEIPAGPVWLAPHQPTP